MNRFITAFTCSAILACLAVQVNAQVIFSSDFTAEDGFDNGTIGFGFPPGDPNPDSIVGQGPWEVDISGTGRLVNTSGTAFVRAIFGLTFGHTPEFPDPFDQSTVAALVAGDAIEIEATGMNWPGAGPNLGVFGLARINGTNILGGSNMAAGVQFTSDGTNVFIDTNTDFTPNLELDTGVLLGADFDYLLRYVAKGVGVFDIEHHLNGSLFTTVLDVTPDFMPVDFESDDTGGFIQDFGAAGQHSVDSLRLEVIKPSVGPEGDFDEDLDVDGSDFLKWQQDGLTLADLQAWTTNYGTAAPALAASAVPEPSAIILGMLGVMAGAGLLRKRG